MMVIRVARQHFYRYSLQRWDGLGECSRGNHGDKLKELTMAGGDRAIAISTSQSPVKPTRPMPIRSCP